MYSELAEHRSEPVTTNTAGEQPLLELAPESPYFDLQLTQELLPDLSEHNAVGTTRTLNRLVDAGSHSLLPYETTVRQAEETKRARTDFYRYLGWSKPDHPMNAWHRSNLSNQPYGIRPALLIQNIRFIRNLYAGGDLPDNVKKADMLLTASPATIMKEYAHVTRLAKVFGWDETTVREIIKRKPATLKNSPKTNYFYARVAAEHGKKLNLSEDPESLLHGPINYLSPQALMGHVANVSSGVKRFGQGKNEKQSLLLSALNSPIRQRRVGEKVMRAYFRREPVHNVLLLQDHYPNLQRFHQDRIHEWNRVTGYIETAEIAPGDTWLEIARLPGKEVDMDALNAYARVGSRRLHNKAPNFEELREKAYKARNSFVEELGWTHPDHPLYELSMKVENAPNKQWPSPSNMIDIITILSGHIADPIKCVRSLGLSLINTKPEVLVEKIRAAEQGFPDEQVLERWPSILCRTPTEIIALGARHQARTSK